MADAFITLEQAAQSLGMSPDELKRMWQTQKIRAFPDRGTLRFRASDIQELARQRGMGSDMEMQAPRPPASGIKSGPRTPPKSSGGPSSDIFDFSTAADDEVDLGGDPLTQAPRSSSRLGSRSGIQGPASSKSGPRSSKQGPKSGILGNQPASDSDVRLVADGSELTFSLADEGKRAGDSNVKLAQDPRSGKLSGPPSSASRKGMKPPPPASIDSGIRLVPLESDSDVKIVGSAPGEEIPLGDQTSQGKTDSDIRLIEPRSSPRLSDPSATEELSLDADLGNLEPPQAKPRSKLSPQFPTSSPFELSDQEITLPPAEPMPADSSDFDLSASPGSQPGLADSSDDFSLELPPDSDISRGPGSKKGASSGISLGNPRDSGISLEKTGGQEDEVDFELSLDADVTPKPKSGPRSSKSGPRSGVAGVDDSSEFELTLDVDQEIGAPSDSEFELTLDEGATDRPQAKGKGDKDIFETDFEVPTLDESGSEAAPLDTDLDSSDFDLALGDSELAVEDESGSQVVALDEEEADAGAETIQRDDLGEEGFEELGEPDAVAEVEEEAEPEAVRERIREKPAPWGALPVVMMVPCVVIMLLVGIMGFELVQSMSGYKPPGFLTKTLSELVGQKMK